MPYIVDFENFAPQVEKHTPEKPEKGGAGSLAGNTNQQEPAPKTKEDKRINPSKVWCFTYNNPEEKFIDFITSNYRIVKYVFQLEKGENGTTHFQGCIKFDSNVRPKNLFGPDWDKIHWEKCSNWEASVRYCQKRESRVRGPWIKGENKIQDLKILKRDELRDWQKDIVDIIEQEPDERKIYWFWEETGGVGKSAFTKFLVARHNAMLLTGKANDMKYAIANAGVYPALVVIDCPRSMKDYISYPGIEEIKNGCFFCGKYESKQVIGNNPHIIIFANFPPDEDKLSRDRWVVREL